MLDALLITSRCISLIRAATSLSKDHHAQASQQQQWRSHTRQSQLQIRQGKLNELRESFTQLTHNLYLNWQHFNVTVEIAQMKTQNQLHDQRKKRAVLEIVFFLRQNKKNSHRTPADFLPNSCRAPPLHQKPFLVTSRHLHWARVSRRSIYSTWNKKWNFFFLKTKWFSHSLPRPQSTLIHLNWSQILRAFYPRQ